MFCSGSGWTFRDELYGITNRSINLGLGLHRSIDILILLCDKETQTFTCFHKLFIRILGVK